TESSAIMAAAIGFVILGLLTGNWFLSGLLVTLGYIFWMYLRLAKLESWVRKGTRISKVYDDNGFVGMIVRDLYQQKKRHIQRKKKIKSILGRLKRNIDALPDATVLLNDDREVIWCNEPARYLLNVRSPQDVGYRISNLIRNPAFLKYLDDTESRDSIDLEAPADPNLTLQVRISAIGGNQILLIARNISDHKKLQESLKHFVADASHELRSPLTVISGHLEMLEDENNLSDPGRSSLKTAKGQTERMTELIECLLLLSEVESYQLRPDEGDRVSISGLVDSTRSALSKYDDLERVEWIHPDSWTVLGVKTELEGICINLVENALKYSTPETPITVIWEKNLLGEYLLKVSNEGPGISAVDLPRLTDRYYRAPRNAPDTTGSGLGLAIVNQVANKHGGVLTIESSPSGTTTFCVAFPSYRCEFVEPNSARIYQFSRY
ncbi:MAG: phosphate regulon sensor protein PhoR, partial [Pseudomonadota bacterium]